MHMMEDDERYFDYGDLQLVPSGEVVMVERHRPRPFVIPYHHHASIEVNFAAEQIRPDPDRAQTSGMPHAYGFIYKQLMRDTLTPHVSIDTNTLYPPSQPTSRECFEFGRQVG